MPNPVRYTKPEVQERIARDYVMGMLSPAASRRCESLRKELPGLDQKIFAWTEHLQPMADSVPELAPRPQVWARIEASLNPQVVASKASLWGRLSFVRGLAIASSLLVFVLVALQMNQVTPQSIDYIAVLADEEGEARFVASASEVTKQLEIRLFGDALPGDSTYQLWALSKTDGEARSLGLVDVVTTSQRVLSEADWRLIIDAQELLVTAEMVGGSAIGEPSEDVISRGLCVRLNTG